MTERQRVVVALDQGTSSTKAMAVDPSGAVVAGHVVPVHHSAPRPGWVEQDPDMLLASVLSAADGLLRERALDVVSVGLSNQRESALAWETSTGKPLGPLLGWQDRRTIDRAQQLAGPAGELVRERSGLPLDPMFSALKFGWLLDQIDPDRSRSRVGDITVGTLDAWLVQRLTGQRRIETGNASRTQLLNVRTADWDPDLLDVFDIPLAALPDVTPSDAVTAPIGHGPLAGARFGAVLGDSHAALFAHGVREPGRVKATYGTGSSVMGLSADQVDVGTGLVETIGWQRGGTAFRAFEGNILSTGATLLWLGQVLGCTTAELADLAARATDSGDVSLVPAFSGLGAPWWDDRAQAVISGFGLGTKREHLARAAFESIPLQVEDVLERADAVSGGKVHTVLTDGGPTRNSWLMQMQADVSGRHVSRSDVAELSATGVAHLAGITCGLWSDADVDDLHRPHTTFVPSGADLAATRVRWGSAVRRARASV